MSTAKTIYKSQYDLVENSSDDDNTPGPGSYQQPTTFSNTRSTVFTSK
jgi:hypothetical protein